MPKHQAQCGQPQDLPDLGVCVGGSAGTLSPPLHSCPNYVRAREELLKVVPFYPAQKVRHLYASSPQPTHMNYHYIKIIVVCPLRKVSGNDLTSRLKRLYLGPWIVRG